MREWTLKDNMDDAALSCVLNRNLHPMSEREVAEIMMRVSDRAIMEKVRMLERKVAFLRGWLKESQS